MSEIARQLVSEGRAAMEHAARNGEQPPEWVQQFMSPAGWERYHHLRKEAGHCDQSITVAQTPIFSTCPIAQEPTVPPGG